MNFDIEGLLKIYIWAFKETHYKDYLIDTKNPLFASVIENKKDPQVIYKIVERDFCLVYNFIHPDKKEELKNLAS